MEGAIMFRRKDDEQSKVTAFFKSTRDKFNKAANDIRNAVKNKGKEPTTTVHAVNPQDKTGEIKQSQKTAPPLPTMPRPKLIRPGKLINEPTNEQAKIIRDEYEKLKREKEQIISQQKDNELHQIESLKVRILNDYNQLKNELDSVNRARNPNLYTIKELYVGLFQSTYNELSKSTDLNKAITIIQDHNKLSSVLVNAYEQLVNNSTRLESKQHRINNESQDQDHKHTMPNFRR